MALNLHLFTFLFFVCRKIPPFVFEWKEMSQWATSPFLGRGSTGLGGSCTTWTPPMRGRGIGDTKWGSLRFAGDRATDSVRMIYHSYVGNSDFYRWGGSRWDLCGSWTTRTSSCGDMIFACWWWNIHYYQYLGRLEFLLFIGYILSFGLETSYVVICVSWFCG